MTARWARPVFAPALAAVLAAGVPAALATPAQAATQLCGATTLSVAPESGPAKTLRAGKAVARGLFVTYSDNDTVLDGGTIAPPDVSSPLAEASVDRTGFGQAVASPFYSPYSDAAGLPNAFTGAELPTGAISEPSRAKVAGRPPQDSQLAVGGPGGTSCVRITDGPLAEAAAVVADLAPGVTARVGDVRALAGPAATGSLSTSKVVLLDVLLGTLHIEQIVLDARAVADGAAGEGAATSLISGLTVGGQAFRVTPKGFEPGPGTPDLSALKAAGIELVLPGSATHTAAGDRSLARATGPTLRLTTPDGRVLTVVLGEAIADAQLDRIG